MRNPATLRISFLTTADQPMFLPSVSVVHPFYQDSFSALYQVEKSTLINDGRAFPTENLQFLLGVLRSVLAKASVEPQAPAYFFDIRTTEEFSQTAPEYALLENLELRHTQPLSIKGMGSLALIMGLQLASLYLEMGQSALVSCSELDTVYDATLRDKLCRRACGFLLGYGSGEFELERFGFCEDPKELLTLVESRRPDWIYTEDPATAQIIPSNAVTVGSNGMLDPLFHLSEESTHKSFRILTLLRHGKHYGYYELYKKGE